MININYSRALTSTTIEVESSFLEKIAEEYGNKIEKEYVPPLFSEFCIKSYTKDGNLDMFIQGLSDKGILKPEMSEMEKRKMAEALFPQNKLSRDYAELIYVKYISATIWTVIYFDGASHKKIFTAECSYETEYTENPYILTIKEYDKHYSSEQIKTIVNLYVSWTLCMSWYIQHLNSFVEYQTISVNNIKKQTKLTNKKAVNKGYNQKIKLTSKHKKYILNEDTVKIQREYNKVKPCWYVRGYYQHFGKEKALKYIPPRINYRDKDKINKKEADKILQSQKRTYELIDEDLQE